MLTGGKLLTVSFSPYFLENLIFPGDFSLPHSSVGTTLFDTFVLNSQLTKSGAIAFMLLELI